MAQRNDHYVHGIKTDKRICELRINGHAVERSENVVDLYWKARRAVNGIAGAFAEVEAVEGFYVHAIFTDSILHDWERAA